MAKKMSYIRRIDLFKFIITILSCIFIGCYTPIAHFDNISINNNIGKTTTLEKQFLFYKECSRNGNTWLYECQSVGLKSIQQAIYLYHSNINLKYIKMIFYPNKNYIRFELNETY